MQRCLFVAAILACGTSTGIVAQDKDFKLSEQEQKLLELTNAERLKEKRPALKPNPVLCEVARAHAANMAKQGKMAHELDGKTPYNRIKNSGHKFDLYGENLARGDVSLAEIMALWMRSKGHRENVLDAEFTEIGIGLANDGNGETYYAEVFTSPRK